MKRFRFCSLQLLNQQTTREGSRRKKFSSRRWRKACECYANCFRKFLALHSQDSNLEFEDSVRPGSSNPSKWSGKMRTPKHTSNDERCSLVEHHLLFIKIDSRPGLPFISPFRGYICSARSLQISICLSHGRFLKFHPLFPLLKTSGRVSLRNT